MRPLTLNTLTTLVVLTLTACGSTPPAPETSAAEAGLTTKDMAGAATTLQLVGQSSPTLLIFEASWCETCNREAPAVVAFTNAHKGKVRVVGVLVDESLPAAQGFVAKHALPYLTVWDPELAIADRFGVDSTPTYLLLDRDGKELARAIHLDDAITKRFAASSRLAPSASVAAAAVHVERSTQMMGTDVDILVAAAPGKEARAGDDIEAAFTEMRRIEALMSSWQETSEVSAVSRNAGIAPVQVAPELFALLKEAKAVAELTDGRFDITFKGVAALWDFRQDPPRLPSDDQIRDARSRIGIDKLVLNETAQTAFLTTKGMAIGLGGIAKGYAVDRAAALLKEAGYTSFVVNAGGDVYAHGRKSPTSLWWVALKHPRKTEVSMAALPVANRAVVTSGDYQRFFMKDGVRYSHIIDPTTAEPASGCQSVTVVAGNTAWADALATGVFVLGPVQGLALVERLENVEAMIIDAAGEAHVSSGLQTPQAAAR